MKLPRWLRPRPHYIIRYRDSRGTGTITMGGPHFTREAAQQALSRLSDRLLPCGPVEYWIEEAQP